MTSIKKSIVIEHAAPALETPSPPLSECAMFHKSHGSGKLELYMQGCSIPMHLIRHILMTYIISISIEDEYNSLFDKN